MPSLALTSAGTIGDYTDCINEFIFTADSSEALFVQGNTCYFGMPANTGGSISLTGTSWTIYIKPSKSGKVITLGCLSLSKASTCLKPSSNVHLNIIIFSKLNCAI
jgi:hypothetical protein